MLYSTYNKQEYDKLKGGIRGTLVELRDFDLVNPNSPGEGFLWKIDEPFIRHFYGGLFLNINDWEYAGPSAEVGLQVGLGSNQDG